MTSQLNRWSDVSSISESIREDAIFAVRDLGVMSKLVTTFTDARGGNPRIGYQYDASGGTVVALAEATDLSSQQFAAAALQTLTPIEIGQQFFVTDLRADSDSPDHIITDGARQLAFAANDYIEAALLADAGSFTGGTIGWDSGSATKVTATWSFLAAAIARARMANKSASVPLACVLHGYQAAALMKTASIAGATSMAQSSNLSNQVTDTGLIASFMGVPIYQSFATAAGTAVYGAVFPRGALAIDWRRPIRVEAQRDASRRGMEFNMSAVFAHGLWNPSLGITVCFDASAPTGA